MIKLLAWQRIQQLFPPKVPSPQTSVSPPAAPKTPPVLPDSETPAAPSPPAFSSVSEGADLKLMLSFAGQKKVQARAVFYPLTGKGQAVNMCYRTLYIGSGKPPQFNASFLTRTNVFGHAIADAPANAALPPPSPKGADMDVCLTNYGHCNYVSGKHACIFYDEVRCRERRGSAGAGRLGLTLLFC